MHQVLRGVGKMYLGGPQKESSRKAWQEKLYCLVGEEAGTVDVLFFVDSVC